MCRVVYSSNSRLLLNSLFKISSETTIIVNINVLDLSGDPNFLCTCSGDKYHVLDFIKGYPQLDEP